MSATLTPSTPTSPSQTERPGRSVPPELLRPILRALATFLVIGGIGLGIALITGAAVVFNILVFTVFTVLWLAFAAALAFNPRTLDDAWQSARELPLIVQGLVWLLFLPIMIGLWIWESVWSLPIRLGLIVALGACNIFVFFPR